MFPSKGSSSDKRITYSIGLSEKVRDPPSVNAVDSLPAVLYANVLDFLDENLLHLLR